MKTPPIRFPLAAMALSLAAGAVQAATPLAATMSVQAQAKVGDVEVLDLSTSSWGALLSPLAIGANATATDNAGNAASAQGYGNAGWSSANAGGISFEGYGWNWSPAADPGPATLTTLNTAQPDWSYTFVAGPGDTLFSMRFNVFASGYTFGLQGWRISIEGGPEGTRFGPGLLVDDPTTSGVYDATLTPGETYTAFLRNNANISTSSAFALEGQMNGNFAWTIGVVPEPSTYALMVLGLAGVGAMVRRRRG